MEEGLAAKLLFPWAGRHLDILTGSLRAVFSATGGFGFPAVVHFGNCICHVAYYLDVFFSLLFFFFKRTPDICWIPGVIISRERRSS